MLDGTNIGQDIYWTRTNVGPGQTLDDKNRLTGQMSAGHMSEKTNGRQN